MIEVEKKFIVSDAQRQRLLHGAKLISEKQIRDTYYDDEKFSLTSKDMWLRLRNGKYELKVALHKDLERGADQYDEIESEDKIREKLDLAPGGTFSQALSMAGLKPFVSFVTYRTKYKQGKFSIDVDVVDFGDFNYLLTEIELLVNRKEQIDSAVQEILGFAKANGLSTRVVPGKIIEYIMKKRPEHFKVLVQNGVAKDEY